MSMSSLNIIFPDQLSLGNEALQTTSNEDLLLFYEPHDSFMKYLITSINLYKINALRRLVIRLIIKMLT